MHLLHLRELMFRESPGYTYQRRPEPAVDQSHFSSDQSTHKNIA